MVTSYKVITDLAVVSFLFCVAFLYQSFTLKREIFQKFLFADKLLKRANFFGTYFCRSPVFRISIIKKDFCGYSPIPRIYFYSVTQWVKSPKKQSVGMYF